MHSHSHGHDLNEEADCLTNLGAVGEALEGVGNVFYGANLYNMLYALIEGQENEDRLGWPLYIGIAFGVISLGAAYAHRRLDIYHQKANHRHETMCEHDHAHAIPVLTPVVVAQGRDTEIKAVDLQNQLLPSEPARENRSTLTIFQKINVVGDAVAHSCGRAGALSGLVDGIATTFADTTLPIGTKGWVLLGSTLFGAVTSASGIRTCYNTMLEQNQKQSEEEKEIVASAQFQV